MCPYKKECSASVERDVLFTRLWNELQDMLSKKASCPGVYLCYHLYRWNKTMYKYVFVYAKLLREGHKKLVVTAALYQGRRGWSMGRTSLFIVHPSVPFVSYADVAYKK